LQVVGLCPTPHKLFEKSLIKNFTKVGFVLPPTLTIALPKLRVRWPGQDDDPAIGSRAKFVRVKPNKHRPVLRDGVEAARIIALYRQTQSFPAASRRCFALPLFTIHYSSFIIHYVLL
jgi:hypothetical protein